MTSEIARRRRRRLSLGLAAAALLASGCATVVEVPVETPLQSKIDVSTFRRVLVAGFVTDLEEADVELGSETTRLIQNQLRSNTRLQILEPDRPPLHDAIEGVLENLGEGGPLQQGGEGPVQARDRPHPAGRRSSGGRWGRSSRTR